MRPEQLISQALATWISEEIRKGSSSLVCQGLPQLDVKFLLSAIRRNGIDLSKLSLALDGFGLDSADLNRLANSTGYRNHNGLEDSLFAAARWRNKHRTHPIIVALASGHQRLVNTLEHFATPTIRDLIKAMFDWARCEEGVCSTPGQRPLIEALDGSLDDSDRVSSLLSLDSVSEFLAAWKRHLLRDPNEAPRFALPYLGLMYDGQLLSKHGAILQRLRTNYDTLSKLLSAPRKQVSTWHTVADRIIDSAERKRRHSLLQKIAALRRDPSYKTLSQIDLEDALSLATDTEKPGVSEPNVSSSTRGDRHIPDDSDFAKASVYALLDNRVDDLQTALQNLEERLTDCEDKNHTEVEVDTPFVGTEEVRFEYKELLLNWVREFCSEDTWGAFIETQQPTIAEALNNFSSYGEPVLLRPSDIFDGKSLAELLHIFDQQLAKTGSKASTLLAFWEKLVELRRSFLPHLSTLLHEPVLLFAGREKFCGSVKEYLDIYSQLYRQLQQNYRQMEEVDQVFARALLERVLALDVVQVRYEMGDGRVSFKAVLLPTHPLHLWRYQRMERVVRGLGTEISLDERMAVTDQCSRADQFLTVLYVPGFPNNRGGNRVLPLANELEGLAIFENYSNAYGGPDGDEALLATLRRFVLLYPAHTRPLRLALVNPPEAPKLLVKLGKLLNEFKSTVLGGLTIEVFATAEHRSRLHAARVFTAVQRDELEAKLAAGRLEVIVRHDVLEYNSIRAALEMRPVHILAIFDEATVHLRRAATMLPYPMSPFTIRREIKYQQLSRRFDLIPVSTDPPFDDFMELIKEAESSRRDQAPVALVEADQLSRKIDSVLLGAKEGAIWLFLADRALPEENKQLSVRLQRGRAQNRHVLLCAANYRRLSNLLRPSFDDCNLRFDNDDLAALLEEGAQLVGGGILDLVNTNGQADSRRVRGFCGMLLAARDYLRRYPDALLVSVDSELSRLWLRLGQQGDRCDLIALRKEQNELAIDCIEVKTNLAAGVSVDKATIMSGKEQIISTLSAVRSALPQDSAKPTPLSAPRNEMLKEVFVNGCRSRFATAVLKDLWNEWLTNLFAVTPKNPVRLQGWIVVVELGNNAHVEESSVAHDPERVSLRKIAERRIQELLHRDWRNRRTTESSSSLSKITIPPNGGLEKQDFVALAKSQRSPREILGLVDDDWRQSAISTTAPPPPTIDLLPISSTDVTRSVDDCWPPAPNVLGLVGQQQAVQQLVNDVNFCLARKERFSDKLLVGPPGVGKSSLARAISQKLLAEPAIFHNGVDIRDPRQIIERLQENKKIPKNPKTPVTVGKCLLFIDEVHAISRTVQTWLLSAIEDPRVTTYDGVEYDFNSVVFTMATTDRGRLLETLRTRLITIELRPYTLEELASIVCQHGQAYLDGCVLPRNVCLEIAARSRCSPREAVRCLRYEIRQHFFAELSKPEKLDRMALGESITLEGVVRFFDAKNVDSNGIDERGRRYLEYLHRHDTGSEERLKQYLQITDRDDFTALDEYLIRLGLVTIKGGRVLTGDGRKYLAKPFDLRSRISRRTQSRVATSGKGP